MKTIKYLILAICVLSVWSCKPEKFAPINTDINVPRQMQGTWALTSVIQVDEDASTKGFPYKQVNVTNVYPYKDLVLTFLGDAQGNPSTFSITNGNSPKITDLTSGNWTVDNAQAPQVITLKNGTAQSTLTLGSYAGLKSGKLNIKRVKMLNGKVILSYQYEFTKK
jgi:hypothetical protein